MDSNIDTHFADKIEINYLTKRCFNLFDNTGHKIPDWTIAQEITWQNFIDPPKTILCDRTLRDFYVEELQ